MPQITDLNNVVDTLLLGGSLVECNGLLHGKTGIAVFFFHHAKHTGNELFEEYAVELIESVLNNLSLKTPISYRRGLAGIGSGFEYLSRQGFLEFDCNDVLEDFDKVIFDATINGAENDTSLYDGLSGLGRYYLFRIANMTTNNEKIKVIYSMTMCLVDLIGDLVSKQENETSVVDALHFLWKVDQLMLSPVKTKPILDRYSYFLKPDLQNRRQTYDIHDIMKNRRLDLYDGYAGVAMNLITQQNQNHQIWTQLL